jgi:hypothetical protein
MGAGSLRRHKLIAGATRDPLPGLISRDEHIAVIAELEARHARELALLRKPHLAAVGGDEDDDKPTTPPPAPPAPEPVAPEPAPPEPEPAQEPAAKRSSKFTR